jgi:hypothetical protein
MAVQEEPAGDTGRLAYRTGEPVLFQGIGLVDPVDDLHDKNPASHPELLDALAQAFAASGFDTRFVLRAICSSSTFGRTSAHPHAMDQSVRLFAYYPVHGLTPEQLFDSLSVALGLPPENAGIPAQRGSAPQRRQFLEIFARAGKPTESPTSILQALTLMNGDLVGVATDAKSSSLLASILKRADLTPAQRMDAIYLAALARLPTSKERHRALGHVHAGDGAGDTKSYADVLWALLNSIEFRTVH